MTVSTISTTITTPVFPGSGNYAANLTITDTGAILTYGGAIGGSGSAADPITVTNYGTISDYNPTLGDGMVFLGQGSIDNFGSINGPTGVYLNGADPVGVAVVANAGFITGSTFGIEITGRDYEFDKIANAGHIFGGMDGISLAGSARLDNSGSIGGGQYGIRAYGSRFPQNPRGRAADGYINVTNSGTISGGVDAILVGAQYIGTVFNLTIAPGAVFIGDVVVEDALSNLILGGSSHGSLNLGNSFTGFDKFDFATGSRWTLEGSVNALANGQEITGFQSGDSIILDGFAATSESFEPGIGLVLKNGSATETLALSKQFPGETFSLADIGGNTKITASGPAYGMPVSQINTAFGAVLTPGAGNYAKSITITSAGTIAPNIFGAYPVHAAVVVGPKTGGVNLLNDGKISLPSRNDPFQYAVNFYSYYGNETFVNAGTVTAGRGVRMPNGTVVNSGIVSAADGVGIKLNKGDLFNSGTINSPNEGVRVHENATVTNSGTISGGIDAVYAQYHLDLIVDPGAAFIGAVKDVAGIGQITLGGSMAGDLDMGSSFTGFSGIDFAAGSQWTLEGDTFGAIAGFTLGDTLIADGFFAQGETYSGAGLVLIDGASRETIGITGSFTTGSFEISTLAGGTEITLRNPQPAMQFIAPDAASTTAHAGAGLPDASMMARWFAPLDHWSGSAHFDASATFLAQASLASAQNTPTAAVSGALIPGGAGGELLRLSVNDPAFTQAASWYSQA